MSLSKFIKIVTIGFVFLFTSENCEIYASETENTLKWKYDIGYGNSLSSPAIGSDGTIYVGSGDSCLYAINPYGALKWKFKTDGIINSSPAIGDDETIYVGTNDSCLYAVNYDGSLKWKYKTEDFVISSPAIGTDGTIYVGSNDNFLYAFNPDGTTKLNYETIEEVHSSPAIGVDGSIYVGSLDEHFYALNPDGSLKWKKQVDFIIAHEHFMGHDHYTKLTGGYIYSSPAIGNDGTIYVGTPNSDLYAFQPDGIFKWKTTIGDGEWVVVNVDKFKIGSRPIHYSSPAIGNDGTIYVGSYSKDLFAINPDGTLKWTYETPGGIDSSPAVGNDGTVYVGSSDSTFYAINTDGTLKWKFKTEGGITSSPIIDNNGIIYFGSQDNNLYAIDSGTSSISGGLVDSPWPAFGGNTLHTHRSDVPTYTVYGSIVKEGKGFVNIQVTLSGNGVNRTVTTDSNGKYSFSYVLNGTYTVTPHKDGYSFIPSNTDLTVSDEDFTTQTITASNYITLLIPNGNENLIGKTRFNITWTPFNVEHIKIDYSADRGLNWTPVASNINASDDSYPWTIPNISSNQCIVKLTDVLNPLVYDMSDSTFTIERDQEYGIQLTSTGKSKSSLCLSPDGNWIAYSEDGDIWVISLEGSEPKNLTEDIEYSCYAPCFTPDSKEVAFSYGYTYTDEFMGYYESTTLVPARNIETLEERIITTHIIHESYTSGYFYKWSKDGNYTFFSWYEAVQHSYVTDLKGHVSYNIENYLSYLDYLGVDICFSPNEPHIVTTLRGKLSKINFENGNIEGIETIGSSSNYYPDYSPDGEWISYTYGNYLYVYNNESGENSSVFSDAEYLSSNGCFSPDGSKIYYLHKINGFPEVFIADFPYYSPVFVDENETPTEFHVNSPYPNPFNPAVTIEYDIPQECKVKFAIYDILGRKVTLLQDGILDAGSHRSVWDGKNQNGEMVGSGVYLFKITAGEHTAHGKVVLLR